VGVVVGVVIVVVVVAVVAGRGVLTAFCEQNPPTQQPNCTTIQ